MAPIACSVNVEIASPIAPTAAVAAQIYSVTSSTRTSPAVSETVVPDSSVTGPTGNRTTPASSATTETANTAATANATIARYFTASSRVHPQAPRAGNAACRSPPSPATESPEMTATATGSTKISNSVSAVNMRNTPLQGGCR